MNLPYFIAKRIAFSKGKSFSRFIIKIATIAVALSLAVMIITSATVTGFQQQISKKVFGFWGHIHIQHFESNRSYETVPISIDQDFYPDLEDREGINNIEVYATKAGIIKTEEHIEGIVLKGVAGDYNWDFIEENIVRGEIFELYDDSAINKILISEVTSKRLMLDTGDQVLVYFIQQPTRIRKFTISGIYNTGLSEYDKLYAMVDIKHIQRLNDWDEDQVGGFQVFIDDVENLEEAGRYLHYEVLGPDLYAQTMKEINPNIFDWLELQNLNKYVIMALMILVASINMVTVLLILILERTNMIGILKALGAKNWTIRKVFLYNAAYIIGLGLFWGNLTGIGICMLQKKFEFITLPQESYYVSVAPIQLEPLLIIALNAACLLITILILTIPSWLITRIKPIKAIRFD